MKKKYAVLAPPPYVLSCQNVSCAFDSTNSLEWLLPCKDLRLGFTLRFTLHANQCPHSYRASTLRFTAVFNLCPQLHNFFFTIKKFSHADSVPVSVCLSVEVRRLFKLYLCSRVALCVLTSISLQSSCAHWQTGVWGCARGQVQPSHVRLSLLGWGRPAVAVLTEVITEARALLSLTALILCMNDES